VTRKIRREIARSAKGRCAVCEEAGLLVLHHINGRDIPDWNRSWNEAWICPSCHFSVHSKHPERIVIDGWVMTTEGKKLVHRRAGRPQEAVGGEEAGATMDGVTMVL
jgi:hypothetical protein